MITDEARGYLTEAADVYGRYVTDEQRWMRNTAKVVGLLLKAVASTLHSIETLSRRIDALEEH